MSFQLSSPTNHCPELLDVDVSTLYSIHRRQHLLHLVLSELDGQVLQDELHFRHLDLPLSLDVKPRKDQDLCYSRYYNLG